MSTVPALQRMRIFAIPLTRPPPRGQLLGKETLNRLTYYQFHLPNSPVTNTTHPSEDKTGAGRKWWPREGVANWATQKAANVWTQFGKAEGGWRSRVYRVGQNLVDRTEFEEIALKSFDPSMGPSITRFKRSPTVDGKTQTISLLYPPSELSPATTLSELRAYAESRIPRHRKGFYLWLFITPFTFPLKLIPVIPNLPFFFCAWRSWSHYRAYKSSQYLKSLLENNMIIPEPSEVLDDIYKSPLIKSPSVINSASTTLSTNTSPSASAAERDKEKDPEPRHILLLSHEDEPKILSLFHSEPKSTTAADLYRAIEQARARISNGRL